MKNDKQQDLEYGEVAIMSFTLPASKAENFLDLVNQHNNHIRELLQMEDEGLSAGAQNFSQARRDEQTVSYEVAVEMLRRAMGKKMFGEFVKQAVEYNNRKRIE